MATSARLDELKKKFDENPRRYFAPLANEYRKLGDLSQAIALCRTHLPNQPGHVSGHIVLAQTLYEARELGESRQLFEASLDLDPENLIALRFLGDIAREQGDTEVARGWYERVLDADPRNDEIANLLRDLPVVPSVSEPTGAEFAFSAPRTVDDSAHEAIDIQVDGSDAGGASFDGAETPAFVEVASFEPVSFAPVDPTSPDEPAPRDESAEPEIRDFESVAGHAVVSVGADSMDDPFFGEPESAPTHGGDDATAGAVESIDDWFHPASAGGAVAEFTVEVTEEEPLPFDESLLPDLRRLTPPSAATTAPDVAAAFESPITPDDEALDSALASVDARASAGTPVFLNAVPEADTPIVASQVHFDGAFDLIDVDLPSEASTPQMSSQDPAVARDGLPPVADLAHETSLEVDSDEVLGVARENWSTPTSVPVSALNDVRLEVDGVDAAALEFAPVDGLVMEDVAFDDVLATAREEIPFVGTTISVPFTESNNAEIEAASVESDDSPAIVLETPDATDQEGGLAFSMDSATETTANASRFSDETDFLSAAEVELIAAPDVGDSESLGDIAAFEPAGIEPAELEVAHIDENAPPERFDEPVWEGESGEQPEEQLDVVAAAAAVAAPSAGLPLVAAAAGDAATVDDEAVVNHSAADEPDDAPVYRAPAFVTETMAELYVQQGFREEALAIYRQLVAARPDDAALRSRLAALEAGADDAEAVEVAETSGEGGGQSVRDFFALFARRNPGRRRRDASAPATVAADAAPSDADVSSTTLAADPGTADARSGPTLNDLFGAAGVSGSDAAAAVNLSAAFAVGDPSVASRTADKELSLEHLFRDVPARSSGAVTLDEYYNGSSARESDASTPAAQHTEEGDERGADIEQFTAWLEGLKKK